MNIPSPAGLPDEHPCQSLMERFEAVSAQMLVYKNKVEVLNNLIEIAKHMNSTLDLSKLLTLIIECSQKVMHADASSLMLLDEQTNELVFEVALGAAGGTIKTTMVRLPLGKGIAGIVAQTGQALKIDDVYQHPHFNPNYDRQTGYHTHSMLCVPLKAKDKLIGVAQVINKLDEQGRVMKSGFSEEDLETFSTFCSLAAIAIENARMHKDCLAKQRIEKELEVAHVIQEGFLPHDFPADTPFLFTAHNVTALQLGGDFYDIFVLPDGRIGVIIGDVAGKGISAALCMSRFMSEFRFLAEVEPDPAATMIRSNNLLTERATRGMFITLLYMSLARDGRSFTWVRAGHLPLLRIRHGPSGRQVSMLEDEQGPPLGIFKNITYQQQEGHIQPQDTFLLYTDGVIEARNRKKEEFGLARLQAFLANQTVEPQQLLNALLAEVNAFVGDASQHDDLTMVMVHAK